MLHFKEHKEKHGETHMIHCRARLNMDKAHLVGVGEDWTPAPTARVALDIIERGLLVMGRIYKVSVRRGAVIENRQRDLASFIGFVRALSMFLESS
jgi:hypothetical protein